MREWPSVIEDNKHQRIIFDAMLHSSRNLRRNEILYQPDDPGVDPDNDANWDFMFSIVKIFFLALIVGCGAICVWLMSMVLYYG